MSISCALLLERGNQQLCMPAHHRHIPQQAPRMRCDARDSLPYRVVTLTMRGPPPVNVRSSPTMRSPARSSHMRSTSRLPAGISASRARRMWGIACSSGGTTAPPAPAPKDAAAPDLAAVRSEHIGVRGGRAELAGGDGPRGRVRVSFLRTCYQTTTSSCLTRSRLVEKRKG